MGYLRWLHTKQEKSFWKSYFMVEISDSPPCQSAGSRPRKNINGIPWLSFVLWRRAMWQHLLAATMDFSIHPLKELRAWPCLNDGVDPYLEPLCQHAHTLELFWGICWMD